MQQWGLDFIKEPVYPEVCHAPRKDVFNGNEAVRMARQVFSQLVVRDLAEPDGIPARTKQVLGALEVFVQAGFGQVSRVVSPVAASQQ
jgi:hypothetical protein